MRQFLKDGQTATETASSETCPLCRVWTTYVQGMAQATGAAVTSFDRSQAHSFLNAGFWVAVNKQNLELCETHRMQQSVLDGVNAEPPPKEEPSS